MSDFRQPISPWRTRALLALRDLAESRDEFTSDDLYELVDDPPDVNMVGTVFADAHRAKIIEQTGRHTKSKRKQTKGRIIQIWTKATNDQGALL